MAAGAGTIDARFVRTWSERYVESGTERRLYERIGPAVAKRGFYTRAELVAVGGWKSPRTATYLGRNSDEDISDITSIALAAPERLRHRILCLLGGVRTPMASALLAVWAPHEYTVMDVRALDTLRRHRLIVGEPAYPTFLELCRALAVRLRTELRSLDKALVQWSREH